MGEQLEWALRDEIDRVKAQRDEARAELARFRSTVAWALAQTWPLYHREIKTQLQDLLDVPAADTAIEQRLADLEREIRVEAETIVPNDVYTGEQMIRTLHLILNAADTDTPDQP